LSLAIYSSGSIPAQKLLFAHTIAGDLTPFLSAYFDTTSGPKRSVDSYRTIATASGLSPGKMLFLSDIPEELDAAREAGLATGLVVRPGTSITGPARHPAVSSFDEITAFRI
jgi:enolase-phosphatase E1